MNGKEIADKMKAPRKPTTPRPPEMPTETVKVPVRIELPTGSKKYCWSPTTITVAEIKETLPDGVADTDLALMVDHCDGDYTDIYFQYYTEEPNPHYSQQMERYENDMKKYTKRVAIYEEKMKTYLPQETIYKEWLVKDSEVRKKANQEKEIQRLKSLLKKLKKNK